MCHAKLIAEHDRKDTETDHIAERIDLNAEPLFIFCPVFLRPSNFSIEHIAQSGKSKTKIAQLKCPRVARKMPLMDDAKLIYVNITV